MGERELNARWAVLETEAGAEGAGLEVTSSGTGVLAGDVLLGVDYLGRRHLLIPLKVGEAFGVDRRGSSVHLERLSHSGTDYLSAVCLKPDLHQDFGRFVNEILEEIGSADSPARATVEALDRWRRLFADARNDRLTDAKIIGLMAELMTLHEIVRRDPARDLTVWTGPANSQHDFRTGVHALEVKATLAREGRLVPISSVLQLECPDAGTLHLVHHRFERSPDGDTVSHWYRKVCELGVAHQALRALVEAVGYDEDDVDYYDQRVFRLVERRTYDVAVQGFPRITPGSFIGGTLPAGVRDLSYTIDLTNEPPTPLGASQEEALFSQFGGAE